MLSKLRLQDHHSVTSIGKPIDPAERSRPRAGRDSMKDRKPKNRLSPFLRAMGGHAGRTGNQGTLTRRIPALMSH